MGLLNKPRHLRVSAAMNNRFFDIALDSAGRMLGKRGRLISLSVRYLIKMDRTTGWKIKLSVTREKLKQLGRLVSAYARGKYRKIPVKSLLTVTAALLYFLNPLDLVPDAIPALGLTDDLAVLTWVYRNLADEMDAFLEWERSVKVQYPGRSLSRL